MHMTLYIHVHVYIEHTIHNNYNAILGGTPANLGIVIVLPSPSPHPPTHLHTHSFRNFTISLLHPKHDSRKLAYLNFGHQVTVIHNNSIQHVRTCFGGLVSEYLNDRVVRNFPHL